MNLRLTLAQDWNWSWREEVIVVECIFISAPLMKTTLNKRTDLFSEKTKKIKRLRTNNQCWLLMKTTANRRTVICLLQRKITSCCCNAHILTWGLFGDLGSRWRFRILLAFLGYRWCLAKLNIFTFTHTWCGVFHPFFNRVCKLPESGFLIV